MWKSLIRRTFLEWVKPQTRESGKRPCPSKNFIPCIQHELHKSVLFGSSSQDNNEEKEKQKRHTCHEHSTNQFRLYADSFLETFGWMGTAFILGLHLRHFCWKEHFSSDHPKHVSNSTHLGCGHLCNLIAPFVSPLVFNMKSNGKSLQNNHLNLPDAVQESFQAQTESNNEKDEVSGDISKVCEDMVGVTVEYFGEMENFVGVTEKNEQKAFVHFRKAAKYGCAKAHFNLGICYETGYGTVINLKKAAEHYKSASEAGHTMATYNLGIYYLEGKGGLPSDEEIGLDLIAKAAKQGVHQAQTHMGVHFLEQENWKKGLPYLKEASNEDPEATYYLAMCYENGWGVNRDLRRASELYKEAATAGNLEALHVLELFKEKEKLDKEKSSKDSIGIHTCSSVPALCTPKDNTIVSNNQREISRYLDIVFPDAWKKHPPKVKFWIEDSEDDQIIKKESSVQGQVLSCADMVAAV